MYKGKKILAVIPAKGISRRLKGKNLKPLAGKPLFTWSIDAARKSACVDRVIVSTDDQEIADVAKRYKADVPFLRPKRLNKEIVSAMDVAAFVLERLKREGEEYDVIVLLQPTSPLRTAKDIDVTVKRMINNRRALSIVSVVEMDKKPEWMKTIDNNGYLKDLIDPKVLKGKGSKTYIPNGAIFTMYVDDLMKGGSVYSKRTICYHMAPEVSMDVDTPYEFEITDYLMKKRLKQERSVRK